ncbi:MAG: hypothetical protein RL038_631 [Actinomycetota bacterium]|jgi:hypothetical protein
MALSEHEQRMLQEMEKALYAEDPRFASSIRDSRIAAGAKGANGWFAVVTVIGLAGIVAGIAIPQPLVGIAGFAVTLFGLYKVVTGLSAALKSNETPAKAPKAKRKGFLKGAEERFDRRRDDFGR